MPSRNRNIPTFYSLLTLLSHQNQHQWNHYSVTTIQFLSMKTPQSIIAETRPEVPKTFDEIKTSTNKEDEEFRVYDEGTSLPRVVEHYRDMRQYQTIEFYRRMEQKYDFTNGTYRKLMSIDEAFAELENYVVGTFSFEYDLRCSRAIQQILLFFLLGNAIDAI